MLVLTAILSGYTGWFYAKKVDLISSGTIQIHGLSGEVVPPGSNVPERLSPTMAVAKCNIRKFRIDTATENMEQAVVRLEDVTSSEFGCLLDEAQTSLEGEPPPNPLGPNEAQKRYYHPLYMTFEAANSNAQTH